MPDGNIGYITGNKLSSTSKLLAKYKVKLPEQPVFDKPDTTAAVILNLKNEEIVEVLGSFGDYQLMLNKNNETGWIKR